MRLLFVVLGDQLDERALERQELDPDRDAVWMAEVEDEIVAPPAHKRRIALFLSAMRHFRDRAAERGYEVHYHELGPDPSGDRGSGFADVLVADLARHEPECVRVALPGDWRVREALRRACAAAEVPLEVVDDERFYVTPKEFGAWVEGRSRLVMEDFYRSVRRRYDVLMEGDEPAGGQWNFDRDNRGSFGASGPEALPRPPRFEPDALTREVLDLVEARWPEHPGSLDGFAEAVTPEQARRALDAFVEERLPDFGTYQDAIWGGEPELYHARLSASLNLGLLDPHDAVDAVVAAGAAGTAPLNAVEGFVRQVLGWREFVRGVYWHFMPEYAERNALDCGDVDVPGFFWDGDTDMACVADAMKGVLELGYSHHIQRLMVLGLFAQLAGVHPRRFHAWHMALYLDAVDWVSLPNALGMSQYGDGGIMGTKPYCASGRYIDRQSNLCGACAYDPAQGAGLDACPFTTLYWDFLARHRERFGSNHRMGFQLANLARKDPDELTSIRARARGLKAALRRGDRL